jgi:hypothetical protein
MDVTTAAEPRREVATSGDESDRNRLYSPRVRKLLIALAIAALMGLLVVVGGTAQNHGCLPWKQAIHVGGSAFSEGDRGRTVCR